MPTVLQFRRGTTTQNNAFTGALGELSIDTDLDTLRVHDGVTAGGFALVQATATQTLTNKTITSATLNGTTIATTINGAAFGNAGATFTGATVSAATIGNASSTFAGASGTFTNTINAATLQAATIGNVGAAHVGASISAATIGNTGATFSGSGGTWTGTLNAATVQAATIGNSGATLTGTLNTATQNSVTTMTSLASVGTITSGTWSATNIALGKGGTNAALTAVNGGVVYSNASSMAITAAGTAGQALLSAGASAPVWTTLSLTDLPDAWTKKSVKAATTAAVTLSAPQTVDGISLVAGDRVLVKDQAAPAENGIYVVQAAGWTRATDADSASKIAGARVNVDSGTVNGGILYDTDFKTTDTLGTTTMTWYRAVDVLYLNAWPGTTSITTLGTIGTGTWSATNIALAKGGTNATLTASAGAIVFSNATAMSLTAVGSANQVLLSGGTGTPTWSNQSALAVGTATTVTQAAQANITSVGTLTGLTVSGAPVPNANGTVNLGSTTAYWSNMYVNTLNVSSGIVNTGANATGNIGSTTGYFNTVFAKATSAQYADVAEKYTSDVMYEPGTVVCFGGDEEVTISRIDHDPAVAGVVSTNPAHLMNSTINGIAVALLGRVPCQVQGPINKGDLVVTSGHPGIAQRLDPVKFKHGCIIGKALESIETHEITVIEVVVGRF